MLRVITFNLNGLRSACNKGFFEFFAFMHAEILFILFLKAL